MAELEVDARISAAEYRWLRDSVGWRSLVQGDSLLQEALDRTWNVVARENDEIVGVGRLLDDGVLYATVWDVIVVPEAQRRGIGTAILERLLEEASQRASSCSSPAPRGGRCTSATAFAARAGAASQCSCGPAASRRFVSARSARARPPSSGARGSRGR